MSLREQAQTTAGRATNRLLHERGWGGGHYATAAVAAEAASDLYEDALDDLAGRIEKGAEWCDTMGPQKYSLEDKDRLRGKAEGLRLALSYLEEMRRG